MTISIMLMASLVLNAIIAIVAFFIYLRLRRVKNGYRYISRQLDIMGAEYYALNGNKK